MFSDFRSLIFSFYTEGVFDFGFVLSDFGCVPTFDSANLKSLKAAQK